ncbi:hypothetical protein [Chelatococcus reniformis]|uniref:Uncharacterized protein n=1 Tax=Chelatococcus reniformis TaxID=1494448 RepID=A0A916XJW2_9HYPH|nr:hypothetical protein [Chelatococcus reniformis]GGC79348.1 hypothetical protein GCM10010994_41780 [Chelatococcus reniformis]
MRTPALFLIASLLACLPAEAGPIAVGLTSISSAASGLVEPAAARYRAGGVRAGPYRAGGYRRGAVAGPRGVAVRGTRAAVGPYGGAAIRRGAVVGPRGNVFARRTVVVNGRYRPYGAWWPAGGAITAGAAIGFVTAATAAAWAGAPPAAGYCWFYTDASRTTGFWDRCP